MRTEILNVKGMTCGGCTSAVTKSLKAMQGVKDVAVDLGQGEVTVQFDQEAASMDDLRGAVSRAGFEVVEKSSGPKAAGGGCCGSQ